VGEIIYTEREIIQQQHTFVMGRRQYKLAKFNPSNCPLLADV